MSTQSLTTESHNGVIVIRIANSIGHNYVTITADKEKGTITDVWNGEFGNPDNFEFAIRQIMKLFKEGRGDYYKWFADLREMKGSFDSKMPFMFTEAMPYVIAHGLLFEAIVQPKQIFARMSTSDTIKKLPKGGEIQHFPENLYAQAKAWINAKVPVNTTEL